MGLKNVRQLLEDGKSEQALQELEELEKIGFLEDYDRLKGLYLKSSVLNKLGEYEESLDTAKRLYMYSKRLDYPKEMIDSTISMADSLWRLGRLDESLLKIKEGEELLNLKGDVPFPKAKKRKGLLINRKGTVNLNKGSLDTALKCFQESLTTWEDLDDKRGIGSSLNNISLVHHAKGELKQAISFLERSLEVKEQLRNNQSISSTLSNLGIMYESIGDLRRALSYHLKALALRVDLANKQDIAISLNNIGLIHVSQGSLDLALEFFNESLSIDVELGNKKDISASNLNLGIVYQYKGNYNAALDHYQRSLALRKELGNELDISEILYHMGIFLIDKGFPDDALVNLKQLQRISKTTGNNIVSQRSQIVEAILLQTSFIESDQAEAKRILEKISGEEIVDKDLTFSAMVNLSRVLLGQYSRTNEDSILKELQSQMIKILDLSEKSQLHDIILSTKFLQAKLELLQMNFDKARTLIHDVSTLASESGRDHLTKQAEDEMTNLKTLMVAGDLMAFVKEKKMLYQKQKLGECLDYLKKVEILLKLK
jgi:tetratricopeptide (TPR) repeat protein